MRRRSLATAALSVAAALVVAGCAPADDGADEAGDAESPPSADGLRLSSPDFEDGEPIPNDFTCAEGGRIPTLEWTGVPDDAGSLGVTVLDPDAPEGTFAHWVIYDLDPTLTGFPDGRFPAGATQAVNSAGIEGWFPPCPPPGDGPHRYEFTLWVFKDSFSADLGASSDSDPGDDGGIRLTGWEDIIDAFLDRKEADATLVGTVDLD